MASGPCFRRNEMDRLVFQVSAEYDGAKLKGFLRGCARLSARLLTAAKRRPGGLLVNGRAATARTPVRQGDRVEVLLPAVPSAVPPEPLPLTAVYEDASLLVAEKPARMPMYPCPGHDRDSLANALSFYLRQRGETPEYHPVYRLDQDTTGLVVLAKDAYAASRLAGRVEKTYLALCTGRLEGKGTVEAPIGLLPATPFSAASPRRGSGPSHTGRPSCRGRTSPWPPSGWKPGVPIKSGYTWPTWATPCWGTICTAVPGRK